MAPWKESVHLHSSRGWCPGVSSEQVFPTGVRSTPTFHSNPLFRRTGEPREAETGVHFGAFSVNWVNWKYTDSWRRVQVKGQVQVKVKQNYSLTNPPSSPEGRRESSLRLTLHLVVEGELLSCVNAARGKQGDSGEPLVDVVDEDVKNLQVGITLQTQEKQVRHTRPEKIQPPTPANLTTQRLHERHQL